MKNLDVLYKLIGASIDDSIDTILDKLSPYISDALNEAIPIEQEGCRWDLKYLNDGEIIRIAKKHGNNEIGYIQFGADFNSFHNSDPDDADLRRMMSRMVLSLLY